MFVVQVLAIAFLQLYFVEETSGVIGVTLSIFSGLPDPHWVTEPTVEISQYFKEAEKEGTLFKVDAMPSRLGYRGFIIQEDQTETLVLGPKTKNLQHKLLLTMPDCLIPNKVLTRVFADIESGNILPVEETRRKRYVPPFSVALWASAARTRKNNCYNYANIKVTNTFAQPGRGSGAMYPGITQAKILAAARRDGLISVANSDTPAGPRHVVALVVEDCVDFHWYLKNNDGTWSHKPGRTPVTQRDNAGQRINNPQNCDMNGYEFVTYMTTNRNTAQIA